MATTSSIVATATAPIPPPAATTSAASSGGGGGPTSSPLLFFVALGFGVVFTNLWYGYISANHFDQVSPIATAQLICCQGSSSALNTALGIIKEIVEYSRTKMATQ